MTLSSIDPKQNGGVSRLEASLRWIPACVADGAVRLTDFRQAPVPGETERWYGGEQTEQWRSVHGQFGRERRATDRSTEGG